MFKKKPISVAVRSLCLASAMAASLACNPAQAAISQTPLFLAQHPFPNIMFTLDNSGSMNFDYLPDTANDYPNPNPNNPARQRNTPFTDARHRAPVAFYRSTKLNHIFYDPNISYDPWAYQDGSPFPPSVPAAAIQDPRAGANSATIKLTEPDTCITGGPIATCPENAKTRKYLAFYYDYKGGDTEDINSYTRVTIDSNWVAPLKPAGRADCKANPTSCTWTEELNNFSNWYTYYRKRILTAIAGVSQSFSALDGKQRVGFGQINNSGSVTVDGTTSNPATVLMGVRDFVGADRLAFFNRLFENVAPGGGTPLRRAMDDVGQYFSIPGKNGPWAEKPGVSAGEILSCRKSYHILMTDGLWNGEDASTADARNADSVDGPAHVNPKAPHETLQYKANGSTYYNNSANSTLADVAMYYWNHDLYPDLADNVPGSKADPAFWQHLTQYTVGLGVDGLLSYPTDEEGLKNGNKHWPDPGSNGNNAEAVDDLWHAAVNGHGLYFKAKDPRAFREGLSAALADIDGQSAAAATVALNFDQTAAGGNLAYIPSFEAGLWLGHLVAREVDASGNVTTKDKWDAAGELPAWNSRNIVTMNTDNNTPVAFSWANLGAAQKALVTADVVDYIRGNEAKEKLMGGTFRNRNKNVNEGKEAGSKAYLVHNKLGDIVDSSPLYVAKLDNGYNNLAGYRDFVTAKADRKPMLYVGANDGMLHGFDAMTGVETLAYVPGSVYDNLTLLTQRNYQHHYFVDGQLNEGDAWHTGSSKWKTLLSGSTGAGARSVFMLDVTDPVANKSNGAGAVKWEISGEGASGDSDMGYMLGKTEVVQLPGGKWAAVFGNGYQSTSGKAVLYVVDAFTGQAISGVPSKITLDSSGSNGLSTPALIFNGKREVVSAYAGDLRGHLWRVDFGSGGNATVAYGGKPLITVVDNATPAVPQPIVQRPAVGVHPLGGYVVMFGTGKFFDTGDQSTSQLQTVYGIWDDLKTEIGTAGGRYSTLQQQTLTSQTGGASLTSITLDWRVKRGWFVDLTLMSGSRAVGDPYVTDNTTFYLTSFAPVATQCESDGNAQLMAFDYLSGGASSVFDSSTAPNHLSVINIASTVREPRVVRVAPTPPVPPCTGNGCTPPTTPEQAACPTRKIIVNQLDGGVSERTVNSQCRAPLRVWHQLDINY
jgi:type IV pilus assembly protein PilY1